MSQPRILVVNDHGADGFLPDTISSDGLPDAVKTGLAGGTTRR